jgi:Arc/MetJ family transcription regulator
MRRTNLVLDGDLLATATRVLGAKTYSAAVNQALEEVLRVKKIRSLPEFFGERLWRGNLSEMRRDRPSQPRRKRAAR